MVDDVLVKMDNVSKKFCRDLKRSLWYGVKDLGSEFLGRSRHDALRKKEFWALSDVSFEVKRGQCLGIVGPNGAGKTTLLRLLSGLIKPDAGRIAMRGRVQALIALGAGFNPILTGRENVYVNASVLGVPKREVEMALDEIIDFAEIGEFIDAPVQSYSAGMKVRLGFSVSILLNPDVMLIDEVLAVGDLAFQSKCTEAILRIKNSGVAFIFVSHNVGLVHNLSDQVAYLKGGEIQYLGEPADAILRYVSDAPDSTNNFVHRPGTEKYIQLEELHVLDVNGAPVEAVTSGQSLTIRLVCDVKAQLHEPMFHLAFMPYGQQLVAACVDQPVNGNRPTLLPGRQVIDVVIPSLPLTGGKYQLGLAITGPNPIVKYATIDNVGFVIVSPRSDQVHGTNRSGFVDITSSWKAVQRYDSPETEVGE